jgi:hypothetical protein
MTNRSLVPWLAAILAGGLLPWFLAFALGLFAEHALLSVLQQLAPMLAAPLLDHLPSLVSLAISVLAGTLVGGLLTQFAPSLTKWHVLALFVAAIAAFALPLYVDRGGTAFDAILLLSTPALAFCLFGVGLGSQLWRSRATHGNSSRAE